MIEIDDKRIERGRLLKELRNNNDAFGWFLAEANDRIQRYKEIVLSLNPGRASQQAIFDALSRAQEIESLLAWLEDEIATGERELTKKREVANV